MAVDLDHGVVDIDEREPARLSNCRRRRGRRDQAGQAGQREQEPGRDRVELADMPEGERTQERSQRRRRIDRGEQPAHATVAQQRHVIDRVGTGNHARDQRGHLQPRVRALVARHTQMLPGQLLQPGLLGQAHHRHQPSRRHQIRIVEHRRDPGKSMRELVG